MSTRMFMWTLLPVDFVLQQDESRGNARVGNVRGSRHLYVWSRMRTVRRPTVE